MTPVFTYHLSRPCGRSSTLRRNCTNSFTIGSCAASDCETNPPSTICVKSRTGESCDKCEGAVSILLENFDAGVFFDSSAIINHRDHLLMPVTQCSWQILLVEDVGENIMDSSVANCFHDVPVQQIRHYGIVASIQLLSGVYKWHVQIGFFDVLVLLEDIPDCPTVGQTIPAGTEFNGGSPPVNFVVGPSLAENGNCVEAFDLSLGRDDFTVRFFPLE